MEIRSTDNEIIIIDAGSGIRRVGDRLLAENRKKLNILFTHLHMDHIVGFPFFKPLHYKSVHMDIYGCSFARESIKGILSKAITPPYFPVDLDDYQAQISYRDVSSDPFSIGSIEITPILLSHPNRGYGYKLVEDGKSFVFLTDNELTFQHPGGCAYPDYLSFCGGADLLIHDAEFTGEEYKKKKGWGHSVYEDALRLALDAGVKRFGLFHHNQDRSDADIDGMVAHCRRVIESRKSGLACFAVHQGMAITM
jgi:ribonuclease BN (tRNA processing enzyme)